METWPTKSFTEELGDSYVKKECLCVLRLCETSMLDAVCAEKHISLIHHCTLLNNSIAQFDTAHMWVATGKCHHHLIRYHHHYPNCPPTHHIHPWLPKASYVFQKGMLLGLKLAGHWVWGSRVHSSATSTPTKTTCQVPGRKQPLVTLTHFTLRDWAPHKSTLRNCRIFTYHITFHVF